MLGWRAFEGFGCLVGAAWLRLVDGGGGVGQLVDVAVGLYGVMSSRWDGVSRPELAGAA